MADIFDLFKQISTESKTASGKPEYLVVGLGNPGAEYTETRHNAGFMALDRIAARTSANIKYAKFKSLTDTVRIGGHSVLLMKPQTYMNNSGEAVSEAAKFYQIPTSNIIVISDDICQGTGRMRVRKSGSAGGQKGLLSIINHLGSDAFPRIRIGVGEKPTPEYDLAAWVLGRFSEADKKAVSNRLDDAYDCISMILEGKLDEAMGIFNGKRD